MTVVGVAPRGFDGTTMGSVPEVFVPMTLRDQMESTFKGSLENRRSYWAYAFARLKPGVSLDRAMSSLNVPYHAIINDVEAPLQKGMSDQTMTRFRGERSSASSTHAGRAGSTRRRRGRWCCCWR